MKSKIKQELIDQIVLESFKYESKNDDTSKISAALIKIKQELDFARKDRLITAAGAETIVKELVRVTAKVYYLEAQRERMKKIFTRLIRNAFAIASKIPRRFKCIRKSIFNRFKKIRKDMWILLKYYPKDKNE